MKASLVYNTKNEPRILIELETATERRVVTEKVDSLRAIRVGWSNELLSDIAFEIVHEAAD